MSKRLVRGAWALLAACGVAGCVSAHRVLPDGTTERVPRDELRAHAEGVFKRHNAVSTSYLARLDALEAADPAAYAALADLESHMYAACAPIDDLAIAYRDGKRVGLLDKLRLARALDACAAATTAAEAALDGPSE
jgi:hypothetical protein